MITVRCPACGKTVGFDESDGGKLVACPHCREPFFIPAVARPAVAVEAAPPPIIEPPAAVPLPQATDIPDDIGVMADPDLDPISEECDEVREADEDIPLEVLPPEPLPEPDPMPRLELDEVEEVEEVAPTDLPPPREAVAVPVEPPPPPRPIDLLEEVDDEVEERDQRPRRKEKKLEPREERDGNIPVKPGKGMTLPRILGANGMFLGGLILVGTLLHHLTGGETAWHWGVCCGDLFALTLIGVGLFFAIKG